jgi:hypothetical protein
MRNCECIGIPSMFRSRVSGLGTPVARLEDNTEITFVVRGTIYETRTIDHPTYGKQTVNYELQVTVKNYVPGSNQVTYTTWGDGLYPGFNPTPNWKTVPETEFTSMFPMWKNIRNNRFGQTQEQAAAEKAESDAMFAEYQKKAAETKQKLEAAKSWRSNTPIASWTAKSPSGNPSTINVYGYNKDLGAVWVDEGPNASAENSILVSEAVLASKSPEWVAAKASLGKSGSALPLLLGAAYLLLS